MRYIHTVVIPVSTSISVIVESDDPKPSLKALYEAACAKHWQFKTSDETDSDVQIGEVTETHMYMNRGNVCKATCPEIELVATEDTGPDEE